MLQSCNSTAASTTEEAACSTIVRARAHGCPPSRGPPPPAPRASSAERVLKKKITGSVNVRRVNICTQAGRCVCVARNSSGQRTGYCTVATHGAGTTPDSVAPPAPRGLPRARVRSRGPRWDEHTAPATHRPRHSASVTKPSRDPAEAEDGLTVCTGQTCPQIFQCRSSARHGDTTHSQGGDGVRSLHTP